jgi:hypothetical protein
MAVVALGVAWAIGLLGGLVLWRLVNHYLLERGGAFTLAVMAVSGLYAFLATVAWRRRRRAPG